MGLDIAGFGAIADFATSVLNRFVPDPAQKAAAILEMQKEANAKELAEMANQANLQLAQVDVNKVEAASPSVFVGGWRPFVGWVCGAGLAYVAIIEPIARFIADVAFGYKGAFPAIDTTITMQVLVGMLGIGVMRSYDKVQGTAAASVGKP